MKNSTFHYKWLSYSRDTSLLGLHTKRKNKTYLISNKSEKVRKSEDDTVYDINEDVEKYFSRISEDIDAKDLKIRNKTYDVRDLMDPDFNPWEVEDDFD